MQKVYRNIFISGFAISFIGTLPIGTLNTTAFQIAASQNLSNAMVFAFAVVLIELIAVRITLIGSSFINLSNKLFYFLTPVIIMLLVYLSVLNFPTASEQSIIHENPSVHVLKSPFFLGMTLSTLNPMHIPFWVGWNSVLIKRKKLYNKPGIYSFYISGIALGSFSGLLIFIYAGQQLTSYPQHYGNSISYMMATIYFGFAIYLTLKYSHNFAIKKHND